MRTRMQSLIGATALGTALAISGSALAAPDEGTIPVGDGNWASVSGEVVEISGDTFKLDHGDGVLTVEMDDYMDYADTVPLDVGSRVTVYGRVDNELYESRKLEASSVYSEARNTYYYASSTDEEELAFPTYVVAMPDSDGDATDITVSGEVTGMDGRELTLSVTGTSMTVDIAKLGYDPTDDVGYPSVETGDLIQVTGRLSDSFFSERTVVADTLTVLDETPTS